MKRTLKETRDKLRMAMHLRGLADQKWYEIVVEKNEVLSKM